MFNYEKREINIKSKNENILKANSKYIVSSENNELEIFAFKDKELTKIYEISCDEDIKNIEMSKIYYNIFLTISSEVIDIFQILYLDGNYKIENRLRIETNGKNNFAKFSEYNEKIIGVVSENNIIRLWNIDLTFNYVTIQTKFKDVKDLIFNESSNLLMVQGSNEDNSYEVVIYDISFGVKDIKIIKRKAEDYIYEISEKNFEKIIFVNKFNIEFMDVNNNTIYKKIELNYNIQYICYYKIIQKLIIFSSRIPHVIDIENNKIESSEKNDSRIFNDFFSVYKNKFYINILREYYIEFFSFDLKDAENKITLEKESNNLFSRKFKKIFAKSNLDFTFSEINYDEIREKGYLKIQKIKEALHNNYSLNLEQKKFNVIDGIKKYNNQDSINDQYIYLLKLIIQDNTNKDLLKLYLNFLKQNKGFLAKEYKSVENFECEYSKYKVAFTPEEIRENFQLEKISEKEEFFNFLEKIKSENDFDKIIDNIKDIELGIFNQGIEFSNRELFWFRNKELVVYALLKLKYDNKQFEKIKLMKFCIEKIFEMKLFENPIILNDYHCLTLLILLIAIPLPEEDCKNNLKLIESFPIKNQNNIINANKILNISNNFSILNYNQAYDAFNNIINVKKIKNFLTKVFCSNVIKQAFQILYPSYIKYPFQTEEDAENYINKHLNFVPFYSCASNGITDKFTSDTYIFLKPKRFNTQPISKRETIELLEKILYTSGIIKTNYHELNHNFYNMFYYQENGNIPLKTPRNKNFPMREGGRIMEKLLFGKIIENINIIEALYILDENNYNKDIYQFKKDFENLTGIEAKKEHHSINGEFSEFNSIYNAKELFSIESQLIFIRLEESENIYIESLDCDDIFYGDIFL